MLQPFLSLKSEFIVFVETIKDSVTSSLKISKAIGIYNKFLQNSVLRFNVTVIYAPTINSCGTVNSFAQISSDILAEV